MASAEALEMTNVEGNPDDQMTMPSLPRIPIRHCSFLINSSFVIRHSSFLS
jgi:hypothetical protein